MSWEIWNFCVIIYCLGVSIYGYIRVKNGPTEKQTAKMEKKFNRTLTEDDITYYKKSIKFFTIACVVAAILLLISMFI